MTSSKNTLNEKLIDMLIKQRTVKDLSAEELVDLFCDSDIQSFFYPIIADELSRRAKGEL